LRHNVHDRIFLFSCLAVAFLLPVYGRLVPPFIGLMFLNWLVDGRFIKNFSRLFCEKSRWQIFTFSLIYMLYLAGMGWSTNLEYGWFDLEVKLSLLVFPLIFASLPLYLLNNRDKILWAFVAGCITGSVVLFGHGVWNSLENHAAEAIYYIPLAWYFHPSYFSMYLNLAIVFLLMKFQDENATQRMRILIAVLVILFMMMTMLLSSKAGLIALFAVTGVIALLPLVTRKKVFPGLTILGMLVVVVIFSFLLAPYAFERFSAVNPAISGQAEPVRIAPESSADRVAIWQSSIGIIKENFWIGTGTGDVKDALLHSYSTGKIIPAYRLRLNAHSQYLQTFITLGITGFLMLVFILLLPAIRAIRKRDLVYLLFLFVFAFNILVESMLEEQAGVVFYAFFNIVLFSMQKQTGTQLPASPPESK
jgi:O-antigen ligase